MSNDINSLRVTTQEKVSEKRARSRAGAFFACYMTSVIISLLLFLLWVPRSTLPQGYGFIMNTILGRVKILAALIKAWTIAFQAQVRSYIILRRLYCTVQHFADHLDH
jgi:hypothetical protein